MGVDDWEKRALEPLPAPEAGNSFDLIENNWTPLERDWLAIEGTRTPSEAAFNTIDHAISVTKQEKPKIPPQKLSRLELFRHALRKVAGFAGRVALGSSTKNW